MSLVIDNPVVEAPGSETTTPAETTEKRYEGFESHDAPEADQPATLEQTVEEPEQADEDTTPELDQWDGYEDFEIDGEVVKIPSKVKDGYLRQQDYTRKTMELAETRKQVEAREQEISSRFQQSEEEFNAHVALQNIGSELSKFEGRNWNAEAAKLQDDPIGFQELQREHMRWQELREYQKQFTDFTKEAATKRTEAAQQDTAKRIQATYEHASKIKGWTPELDSKITNFAGTMGFDKGTLTQAITPQIYQMLHDAYQWNQSLTRQQTAKPTPNATPLAPTKTVTAKANATPSLDPEKMSMDDYVKYRNSGKL